MVISYRDSSTAVMFNSEPVMHGLYSSLIKFCRPSKKLDKKKQHIQIFFNYLHVVVIATVVSKCSCEETMQRLGGEQMWIYSINIILQAP